MLFNQTWKPILVSHWLEKQHSDRTPTHHIQEDVYESYTLYFRIDNSGSNWKDFSHVAKILNHLKSWWEDLKLDQRACRRFTHSRNAPSGFHRQKGINNPVRAITGVRHSCYSSITFPHPKLVKDGVEWLPPKQRPPAHTADYSKSQNIAKWLAMKPQRWGVFSPSSKNPLGTTPITDRISCAWLSWVTAEVMWHIPLSQHQHFIVAVNSIIFIYI